MANKKPKKINLSTLEKEIRDMNVNLNKTLDAEISALIGDDRSDRIKDTLDKYNDLIKNNIYIGSKPVNISAKNAFNSILGGLIGDKTGDRINTGNAARILNSKRLR